MKDWASFWGLVIVFLIVFIAFIAAVLTLSGCVTWQGF